MWVPTTSRYPCEDGRRSQRDPGLPQIKLGYRLVTRLVNAIQKILEVRG